MRPWTPKDVPAGAVGYAVYRDVYRPHGPLTGGHWTREDDGSWTFYPHHKHTRGLKCIGRYDFEGRPLD